MASSLEQIANIEKLKDRLYFCIHCNLMDMVERVEFSFLEVRQSKQGDDKYVFGCKRDINHKIEITPKGNHFYEIISYNAHYVRVIEEGT